ncbi:hypothetical protein LRP88_13375 [Fusarium phalaenopsidis]
MEAKTVHWHRLARSHAGTLLGKAGLSTCGVSRSQTAITKAHHLTGYEIFLFSDLTREWAKIEEGSGEAVPLTTEVMASFFKAVFNKWDSGCVVAPLKKKPKIEKEDKGIIVGEWSRDLEESHASKLKRKKEGKDESEATPSKYRRTGEAA